MKAIFIDPVNQTVSYVNISTSDDIVAMIQGHLTIAVGYRNGDALYVSDDGLVDFDDAMVGKADAFRAYMFDVRAHQPFAGYGLIVGENEEGELVDAKTDIDEIRRVVSFYVPKALTAKGPRH